MSILKRFEKHLNSIEYPDKKSSWNIAGILKNKNSFHKFDVRGVKKTSENKAYKTGRLNTEADKMVFELQDKWVILDIEELHEYIKENKLKDMDLQSLLSDLEWNIVLSKKA